MRNFRIFTFSLLLIATLFSLNAFAQAWGRQNLPEGAKLRLGKGAVNDIAASPDGTRLAVASSVGIWIYDAVTGAEVSFLTGHSGPVTAVVYSADSNTLASNGGWPDNTIRLWDARTGEEKLAIEDNRHRSPYIAISRDGLRIASLADSGARIFNAIAGELVQEVTGVSAWWAAFSPDGLTLALAGASDLKGFINLYDVGTARLTLALNMDATSIESLRFSDDGLTLAAVVRKAVNIEYYNGGYVFFPEPSIVSWDTSTGEVKSTVRIEDYGGPVAISPDLLTFAMGRDTHIELWDSVTGEFVRSIVGDRQGLDRIEFSSDGNALFGDVGKNIIQLFDIHTSKEPITIVRPGAEYDSVAYSPDGNTIASGGDGIRLWDANTGEFRKVFDTRGRFVSYSPDGLTLAVATNWSGIELLDAQTGLSKMTINWPGARTSHVAYSPNGSTIAGWGRAGDNFNGSLALWDAQSGEQKQIIDAVGQEVSAAYSPDGLTLAIADSSASEILLLDTITGKLKQPLQPPDYIDSHQSVAYSPDGLTIASFGSGYINLWNAKSGQLIHNVRNENYVSDALEFSPDGLILALGLWRTIELLDARTLESKQVLEGHSGRVSSIAFSPDGMTIASASGSPAGEFGAGDGTILLWDLTSTPTPSAPPYTPPDFSDSISLSARDTVHGVAFSPNGATLATGNADNSVSLWWSGTGQLQRTLSGHEGRVRSVAFSPDGLTVASGSVDKTIRLWDADTGQLGHTLQHYGTVWNVSFSHDGTLLASGAEDARVRVWDMNTGRLRHTLLGHSVRVWSTAFSPDGSTLASSGQDPDIRLWDVRSGELLMTLSGHEDRVLSVAFSPDGASLVSSSADATVRVWDVATGENRLTLSGHTDWVFSVAASSDGRLIVSGSKDQSVRLWDIATGDHLDTLLGHTGWVRSVAISPDGMAIASGGYDNVINLWGETTPIDTGVSDDVADDVTHDVPPPNPSDVNGDGVVNIADLVVIAQNYGKTVNGAIGVEAADVNGDGVVDAQDFVMAAGAIDNAAAAPSARHQGLGMLSVNDVRRALAEARTLNLADPVAQRGILYLERLLAALIPKETVLLANYPNPFNPETWIPYRLATDAPVRLCIYDRSGGAVRTINLGHRRAAAYESRAEAIYWDGRNDLGEQVASGLYFYTLSAGDYRGTRKMLVGK